MVWPFSKKKVIDWTGRQPAQSTNVESSEYKDMTSGQSAVSTDLFSAMASSASSGSSDLEAKGIKNKIEDVEYKLENLRKKLNDLLDRFEVVEKRLGRSLS
jgi:DNA repair ATPase RecN